MEMSLKQKLNLTNFNLSCSKNSRSKLIKIVNINKELIVLKVCDRVRYFREKKKYILLKNENFLPKLKYFDDIIFILGLTYVGYSIEIYKNKHKSLYNKNLSNFNKQIKRIIDKLQKKYGVYHNDLREKNICIYKKGVVRFIDFESCNKKLKKEKNFIYEIGEENNL